MRWIMSLGGWHGRLVELHVMHHLRVRVIVVYVSPPATVRCAVRHGLKGHGYVVGAGYDS